MDQGSGPAREIWRVADLVVDVGRQRVTRGEQPLELPPLSFDLLLALARAAPNVLSNEDLMRQVWPGLVVSPETVVQRVKLLRAALGDDPTAPRYVAGLRGRGYHLVPAAIRADGAPEATTATAATAATAADPPPPPAAPAPRARARPPGLPRLVALTLALLGVAAIAWQLRRDAAAPDPSVAAQPPAANPAARTVAVLPFRNLSPDAADAFIAEGVPEVVLDRLATVPGLTVVARDSAFSAGAQTADPRELGRRLGAAYLVDGSVQRQGDALRVTARLVSAQDGVQLWSTRYDRRLGELFALQDEIAARVATTLEARVSGLGMPAVATAPTRDMEAYLAWLKGRALIGRYTIAEANAAAAEFERAISHDPGFAAAHAALYDARMQAGALQLEDAAALRARHRPLLQKALELDPDGGSAAFARAMWEDADNASREARFREALRLDPGNSRGITAFSEFLDAIDGRAGAGRVRGSGLFPQAYGAAPAGPSPGSEARAQEAARLLDRAIAIDPLSPRAHFRRIQRSIDQAGSVETAMEGLLALDPDYYPALQRVAKYRWLLHDSPSQAIALIEKAIAADPLNPWARHTAVAFYLDLGDVAAARDVAAGSDASRITAAPVLRLHAGDARAAAQAAARPESFVFGFNESWGSAEALRDAALQGGDAGAALTLLARRYDLPADGPDRIGLRNFRNAVQVAHLLQLQGRGERAQALLGAVIAWIDADRKFGTVYKRRTRAEALMLLGRRDEALRELAASFQVDRDHTEWWYTLERNPVWVPVHDEPVFRTLHADVRAFVARERAAVEQLRARGEIPRRPAAKTAS